MRELICITCPRGCHLQVDENTLEVTGNTCPRGKVYGVNEVTDPKRMITSTVVIKGASLNRLPVKTDKPISKKLIFEVMKLIDSANVESPVKRGDVIIENVLGTDVNIISCRDL